MKFCCELCNYESTNRSNFEKHNYTDKHLLNEANANIKPAVEIKNKQFMCSICSIYFSTASGLSRHKPTCSKKNDKFVISEQMKEYVGNELLKEKYNALEENYTQLKKSLTKKEVELKKSLADKDVVIKELRTDIKKLAADKDVEIKKLAADKDYEIKKLATEKNLEIKKLATDKDVEIKELYNRLLEKPVSQTTEDIKRYTMSSSKDNAFVKISAFSYIKKYYNECPPIKNFDEPNLLGEDDTTIAENAIYALDKKQFHVFIGDVIIKIYKKEDHEIQPLWSSDVNRVVYIFRCKLGENTQWIQDSKGLNLSNHIIIPTLKYVNTAVDIHHKNLIKNMNPENDVKSLKSMELCAQLSHDIYHNVHSSQILKYIAPSFKLYRENDLNKMISNDSKALLENNNELEEIEDDEIDEL
ncbi:MAG: hypothetical protein Harvfovirus18_15 [Harvfovirus sp.]|uniref:C2H2-type domain-containing protein n=1 Tax=Harvfovirus sp. TaxID=2487768 RepID=A0A3G5A1Q2_9VIRU|nr:MAG: hypothetical protein Harvfovirus18_15 [Harvfovirus sp.]